VLGAWAVARSANDPDRTARDLRRHLEDGAGAFELVVFAVIDWSNERRTLGPFIRVFRCRG
jgi:hypothetical protein